MQSEVLYDFCFIWKRLNAIWRVLAADEAIFLLTRFIYVHKNTVCFPFCISFVSISFFLTLFRFLPVCIRPFGRLAFTHLHTIFTTLLLILLHPLAARLHCMSSPSSFSCVCFFVVVVLCVRVRNISETLTEQCYKAENIALENKQSGCLEKR